MQRAVHHEVELCGAGVRMRRVDDTKLFKVRGSLDAHGGGVAK